MKRLIVPSMLLIGIVITVIMSGCSSTTSSVQPQVNTGTTIKEKAEQFNAQPDWTLNPTVENGIGAVGIAKYTSGGPSFMIPEAELYGNLGLAQQIQNEISGLKQSNKKAARIAHSDDWEDNFRQIAEGYVKKITISGAKRIKTYQSPANGDMYVLMAIDFNTLADRLENKRDVIKRKMEEAAMSREEINQGMQSLDKEIARLRARAKQE